MWLKRIYKGYKFGWLEFIFAMYPILMGYQYGSIPLSLLVPIIMCMIAIHRQGYGFKSIKYWPIIAMLSFVIIHEIVLSFTLSTIPGYFFNALLATVIHIIAIIIITPAIDYEKLRSSLFLVAAISIGGLIYHFILLMAGGVISPIKLPFLPELPQESRIYQELNRPTSFYWEPASLVTFLMIPMFIALNEKKYVLAAGLMFSIFLSTSTNGIALSAIMMVVFIFTQKVKIRYKVLMVLIMVGMGYMLLTSEMFTGGLDKINNTDLEENARTMNGILLVTAMPLEDLLFGFPAVNVDDYAASGLINASFIARDKIFVPTFWIILAKYGFFGLLIYLTTYLKALKRCKPLLPYMIVLFVAFFTQGISLSSSYTFQMIFILVFMNQYLNTTT